MAIRYMEALFGAVGIRPVERFISNFNGKMICKL